MTNNLIEKVKAFTEKHALFEGVRSVVIGVSGGADSMCLMDMLHRWGIVSLSAVHIHHGIRGAEADRDVEFVRQACERRGIPLTVVYADVPSIAQAEGLGIEETGRLVRYEVFRHVKQQIGADRIVTAHTASDQVETVLHNVVRGCGLSGLGGMSAIADDVIRPLLGCSRADIEQYCTDYGVKYVVDSTNMDETYTRNALRYRVLPMLRSINPSVDDAVLRLSEVVNADEELLSRYAEQQRLEAMAEDGTYDRRRILQLPLSIRYRILRGALEMVQCRSMEYRHFTIFDEMMRKGNGCVQLPGGFSLRVQNNRIYVGVEKAFATTAVPLQALSVDTVPFHATFGQYVIRMSIENRESMNNFKKVHKMFFKYTLDYDKINAGLHWRVRRAGDYLHPAGRHVGKSLKSLMTEWRLEDRVAYPLLCDCDGLVMVPGYCCDERVRTDEDTNHFLVCTVKKVSP